MSVSTVAVAAVGAAVADLARTASCAVIAEVGTLGFRIEEGGSWRSVNTPLAIEEIHIAMLASLADSVATMPRIPDNQFYSDEV